MYEVLDQVLEASTQEEAHGHLDNHREQLEEEAPSAFRALEEGFSDATAVLALPQKYRRRLRTTNMLERFIPRTYANSYQQVIPHSDAGSFWGWLLIIGEISGQARNDVADLRKF